MFGDEITSIDPYYDLADGKLLEKNAYRYFEHEFKARPLEDWAHDYKKQLETLAYDDFIRTLNEATYTIQDENMLS